MNSILNFRSHYKKKKQKKDGSYLWPPSQQPFKGKEAKQISILAMVNLFSGKYSETALCLEHESYMCSYKVTQQLILISTRWRF